MACASCVQTSDKPSAGITSCRGCKKDFCRKHFNEHRDCLMAELDEVAAHYDILQNDINDKERSARFLKQIDEWESQMIVRIQAAANDVRKSVEQMPTTFTRMTFLISELREGHEMENFLELDITRWKTDLKMIKATLDAMEIFTAHSDQINWMKYVKLVDSRVIARERQQACNDLDQQMNTFKSDTGKIKALFAQLEGLFMQPNQASHNPKARTSCTEAKATMSNIEQCFEQIHKSNRSYFLADKHPIQDAKKQPANKPETA